MALQVWLPLDGDLHNQGLNKIQFTNNGATINDSGKIGKCYSFNGSSNTIYNRNISINCNKLSMCCWIYRNSSSSAEGYIASLNNGAGYIDIAIGLDSSNATTIVFVGGGNSTLRTTIASDTWIHVAVTYDGQKIKGYINGQKIGEQVNTTILNKSQLAIGCRCDSTNSFKYYFPGKINDFRLYDHCLSDKEVKEISKGLILHWQLKNSVSKTNWLLSNYIKTITRASSNTFIDYDYYSDLISNTETSYIVDFDAKGSVANMKLDLYFRNSSGSAYAKTAEKTLTTNWAHYSLPLEGSPETLNLFRARCMGGTAGDIIYLRNVKLLSANMPLRDNIIYDCSGFNNNGTITGTVTLVTNIPGLSYGIYMNNTNTANHIQSNNTLPLLTDGITASFWVKCAKATGQVIFAHPNFEFGILNNLGYVSLTSTAGFNLSNFITNEWNHICVIRNGTTYKLYVNGVAATQNGANNNYVHNASNLYLLNRSYNNNYAANASLSDFRIYATELSVDDIKELYRNSKIINGDNKSPRNLE